MLRAFTYQDTGDVGVLRETERPLREPGLGEVRVRVVVSAVNPTDWKARRGDGFYGALEQEQVPNQDGAGIVDAIGEDIEDIAIGDRVWLWEVAWQSYEGTAQQYVTLPRRNVAPLPDSASFDLGASLGVPALMAHRALTSFEEAPSKLSPGSLTGRTVLVAGGAGAVGHAAIELAKWSGAEVIATVSSPAKADLAIRAGADHVINYRSEDVAQRVLEVVPGGVDIIVEVRPIANWETDIAVIAQGGTIALYVSDENTPLSASVLDCMVKNVRLQFIVIYTISPAQKDAAVEAVTAALQDGALSIGEAGGLPIKRFPFSETAEAHAACEAGVAAKVLIQVDSL